MRAGFGRNLEFSDIYTHITNPERVYLLRNEGIKAMASYNSQIICGFNSLVVEGVAVAPEFQGKGVFQEITKQALGSADLVFLRTQSPRMYRALEKITERIYPNPEGLGEGLNTFLREFAKYLNCKMDERGVVRSYYGRLLYGEEPTHCKITDFFKKDLKMDLSKGDALLVMGIT